MPHDRCTLDHSPEQGMGCKLCRCMPLQDKHGVGQEKRGYLGRYGDFDDEVAIADKAFLWVFQGAQKHEFGPAMRKGYWAECVSAPCRHTCPEEGIKYTACNTWA